MRWWGWALIACTGLLLVLILIFRPKGLMGTREG